jgi:hypothetical protein
MGVNLFGIKTQKQLDQQELFQEAVIYGKTVMVTPELKAM